MDGISQETDIATHWSRTDNIVWRVPLPGPAGATPVVWDDRIFLTTVDGENLDLLCISTGGKPLWSRTVGKGNKKVRGDEGNSASPSPCTDGKHVWTFMGNGSLACYDVDGTPKWKFNVQDRYGRFNIAFGMTSTPLLDGDRLYLQLIHGDGNPKTREATIVCLNNATGKEVWKHRRQSDATAECEHSYTSPALYRDDDREFLVTHGADYVIGHDLETGDEIWRCGDLNPKANYNGTLRFVASPLAADNLIIVPTAKRGPVVAIRPTAQGDVTGSDEVIQWKMPRDTPDVPSPLLVDGLVYLCRENGNLICLDAETGQRIYHERTVRERHRASPVYADGKIYLTARNGEVTVVRAGRSFEIVASNKLGEEISASPVIANGTLYFRSFKALYAIREAK
jgi:outer membrane protein assembly factor BamB